MSTLTPQPTPPELTEDADRAPRWPAWYAPAAFGAALVVVAVTVAVLAAAVAAAGGEVDGSTPGLTVAGTLVQDATLVAAALVFASLRLRPRTWHFGLRRTSFWPALGWTVVAVVGFYLTAASYTAIVEPAGEQTVLEDLGAERGTLLLLMSAVLVVGIAPFAEELFFRGFFYGALRTRFGVWSAAGLNGLLFGAIHYSGPDTLGILPPLAVLGFVLCLLYERTGSLYPVIAFHSLNNAIAFAAQVGGTGALAALAVGCLATGGCLVAAGRQRHAPLPFGKRQWAGAR
ncbi:MAG: lysostaphin resistance A-like protein [Thermoleophilaceae bacterium]